MPDRQSVLRPPTEAEQIIGPEMCGYIHEVILDIPNREKYFSREYQIVKGDPVWIIGEKPGSTWPITCPDYTVDIHAVFGAMYILYEINHELHQSTLEKIEQSGGVKILFSSAYLSPATTICKHLVAAAKEIATY